VVVGCILQPKPGCPAGRRGKHDRQGQGQPTNADLEGRRVHAEFRSLLNKAAKKAGKTQAEFAAEVLAAAARRTLSDSNPHENPPPATVQQLEDMRAAVQAADLKAEETRKTVQDLAQKVQQLAEASARRGIWQRISGR